MSISVTRFWRYFPIKSSLRGPLRKANTVVISKSKERSEILRDIRTSTYQNCRTEEKLNRTTTFHKWICNLTSEVRDILKYCGKDAELLLRTISSLFDIILSPVVRFSLRDKL